MLQLQPTESLCPAVHSSRWCFVETSQKEAAEWTTEAVQGQKSVMTRLKMSNISLAAKKTAGG